MEEVQKCPREMESWHEQQLSLEEDCSIVSDAKGATGAVNTWGGLSGNCCKDWRN